MQWLRVPRGSAGDPLNLLQVMLAKGVIFAFSFAGFVRLLFLLSGNFFVLNGMIASKNSIPHSSESLPNSRRVYVAGKVHRDLRVPFREISLSATRTPSGRVEANEAVRVYDCSGPWGDPCFEGDVEQGLPALQIGRAHV